MSKILMCGRWLLPAVFLGWFATMATAQPQTVDGFDRLGDWELILADGVHGELTQEDGSIRLDYDFSAGAGYIVLRKHVGMDIDRNYRFGLR
ncbi:MAG TPA: hypothetical protein DF699_09135, partial [Phycisphaerales bacterium]|nr:hypothetical protein [Phycisphaerales bacterium]